MVVCMYAFIYLILYRKFIFLSVQSLLKFLFSSPFNSFKSFFFQLFLL